MVRMSQNSATTLSAYIEESEAMIGLDLFMLTQHCISIF